MNPIITILASFSKLAYDACKDLFKLRDTSRKLNAKDQEAAIKDALLTALLTGTRTNNGNVIKPRGIAEYRLCMDLVRERYLVIVPHGFALPGTVNMQVFR